MPYMDRSIIGCFTKRVHFSWTAHSIEVKIVLPNGDIYMIIIINKSNFKSTDLVKVKIKLDDKFKANYIQT